MILQLLNFKWRLHPRGSHPLLAPFQNFLGSLPQEIYRDSSALLQTYQLRTQETGLKNLFRKQGVFPQLSLQGSLVWELLLVGVLEGSLHSPPEALQQTAS